MSYEDPRRKQWICRACRQGDHRECKGYMGGDQCVCSQCDTFAPIGTLQNVLEVLNEAVAQAVVTPTTNPPGVTGLAGQAMTGWIRSDRVLLARDRLAAVMGKQHEEGK